MTQQPLIAGIEAGGTKFVCAIGSGPALRARVEISTGDDPAQCLAAVSRWCEVQQREHGQLAAVGIACFGPVDVAAESPTYGHITNTPKPGWAHVNVLSPLRAVLGAIPMAVDTDVNGAALGEWAWGAAAGLTDFVYLTIGTGLGGGGMARGKLLHGLLHPEMGHMRLPKAKGDTFPGVCPYHGDCWEGLCSGPAMEARTGTKSEQIAADDPAWGLQIEYTAAALANLVCVLSPQRIIVGGSVRKGGRLGQRQYFAQLRNRVREALRGYVAAPELSEAGIHEYIVPPALGDDAGVCGAIALGRLALHEQA